MNLWNVGKSASPSYGSGSNGFKTGTRSFERFECFLDERRFRDERHFRRCRRRPREDLPDPLADDSSESDEDGDPPEPLGSSDEAEQDGFDLERLGRRRSEGPARGVYGGSSLLSDELLSSEELGSPFDSPRRVRPTKLLGSSCEMGWGSRTLGSAVRERRAELPGERASSTKAVAIP